MCFFPLRSFFKSLLFIFCPAGIWLCLNRSILSFLGRWWRWWRHGICPCPASCTPVSYFTKCFCFTAAAAPRLFALTSEELHLVPSDALPSNTWMLSSHRCFQERSQVWHFHGRHGDVHSQFPPACECLIWNCCIKYRKLWTAFVSWHEIWTLFVWQGLSFHLGAVLISLGFITYIEHGESRPRVLPSTLEAFHLEKVLSVAVTVNCSRYGTVALLTAVPVI